MSERTTVVIRDVAPRDGLPSEAPVSAATRAALAIALSDAGLTHVEAVSFVSPKTVPSAPHLPLAQVAI
jgi:hydroxymethylglutaryl-CoA lyase